MPDDKTATSQSKAPAPARTRVAAQNAARRAIEDVMVRAFEAEGRAVARGSMLIGSAGAILSVPI